MNALRRHNFAKWNTRRFNAYMDASEFRFGKRWAQHPNVAFIKQNTLLIIWDWLARLDLLCSRWRWAGDQHNCSCTMCRCDTRKVKGNAWAARPISERKLINSLSADIAGDNEAEFYGDYSPRSTSWIDMEPWTDLDEVWEEYRRQGKNFRRYLACDWKTIEWDYPFTIGERLRFALGN